MDDQEAGAAPGARQATPQQQKQFELLAKQAMQLLLSEQSTELILAGARARGGEQAISDAVVQVMSAAVQAASAAGVQVGDDVINAAAQPAVMVLVRAAESAGLVKDGQAALEQVMAALSQGVGGESAEPAAEEATEGPAQEAGEASDGAGASLADRQEF